MRVMKTLPAALAALLLLSSAATARPVLADGNDAMAERAVSLLESAASLADRDAGKCDQMGDDLSGFIDARSGDIAQLRSWGMSLSSAERRALVAKYKSRFQAAEHRLRADITPCASNAKVRAALQKVGIG
jgi:hypothetical protein